MSALAPFGPMTMRVGPRFYPVASLAEASRMFCAARDKAGTGASETPRPLHDRRSVRAKQGIAQADRGLCRDLKDRGAHQAQRWPTAPARRARKAGRSGILRPT